MELRNFDHTFCVGSRQEKHIFVIINPPKTDETNNCYFKFRDHAKLTLMPRYKPIKLLDFIESIKA